MTGSPLSHDDTTSARKTTASARMAMMVTASAATLLASTPAVASDGCTVLLCLAAPSWGDISECVPPVRRVLRDLARGKPFPVCSMSGSGSQANHAWSAAPAFCPPQYTVMLELESGFRAECLYDGAITVMVDGAEFTRTWWRMSGDSVTDFSPEAKARLGTWNPRFDADYATWLASRPAPVQAD